MENSQSLRSSVSSWDSQSLQSSVSSYDMITKLVSILRNLMVKY